MKTIIFRPIQFVWLSVLFCMALVVTSCDDDDDEVLEQIQRISVKVMPKLVYAQGQTLDLSEMVLTVDKSAGSVDVPFDSFEEEGIECIPANGSVLKVSDQSVVILHTASGKGITQPIEVTNMVTAITVKNSVDKDYVEGERLDLSELTVTLKFEDNTTKDVSFEDFGKSLVCTPANGDILTSENQGITITHVATGVSQIEDITVNEFSPVSASVLQTPEQMTYTMGDKLNLEGLTVQYDLGDGKSIVIPYSDFANFGITTLPESESVLELADATIVIAHLASKVDVSFGVTISSIAVTGMQLKVKPNKAVYVAGDIIDLDGLIVTLSADGIADFDVPFADFDLYKITASPNHGDTFIDGTEEIVLTCDGYAGNLSIPLGSTIVYASNFAADGTAGWSWNENGGGSVDVSVENGELVVDNIVLGANAWDVQLLYPGFTLETGAKYKYTIEAKAAPGDGDFWLPVSIGDGDGRDGWGAYDGNDAGIWFSGDTQYSKLEKEFVMSSGTTDAARLVFSIGKQTNGIVIKSVKIEKL